MALDVCHGELRQLGHGREVPIGAPNARVAEVVGEQRQPAAYVHAGPVRVEQCPHNEAMAQVVDSRAHLSRAQAEFSSEVPKAKYTLE